MSDERGQNDRNVRELSFPDWKPHKSETWSHRFARIREAREMFAFKGWNGSFPIEEKTVLAPGTLVKIVMVSRFGDVGITEHLYRENGYGSRCSVDDLYDFSVNEPRSES